MLQGFIQAGCELVNLAHVARARWDGSRLFLYTSGGYVRVEGEQADAVWAMLEREVAAGIITVGADGEHQHSPR